LNKPKYVRVDNELYEINTDFRVAIECERILRDTSIGNLEKILAVLYMLFGECGLDCENGSNLFEKRHRVYFFRQNKKGQE